MKTQIAVEYRGELDAYVLSKDGREYVLPVGVRLDYLIDGTGLETWPTKPEPCVCGAFPVK